MMGAFERSKRPGSPWRSSLGEKLCRPFVVVIPQFLEQLRGKAGTGLDLSCIRRRYNAILGEGGSLEVAVLSDNGLVVEQAPQPRNINAVGGEVIHKAQLEFVVVDGCGEIAVEDLEAVVRCHVERVLDVLNGDLTLGHVVDGLPKFCG